MPPHPDHIVGEANELVLRVQNAGGQMSPKQDEEEKKVADTENPTMIMATPLPAGSAHDYAE